MSAIFGICGPRRTAITDAALRRIAVATERYGVDGTSILTRGRLGMGYQAFRTSKNARSEVQPFTSLSGDIATFDGRLDNYKELASDLRLAAEDLSEAELLLHAFAQWGVECFCRIVGEWALALWSPAAETLYLARDHAGTRTLFFEQLDDEVQWSTYLETFFVAPQSPGISGEYIVRSLALQETHDLTPYRNIRTVMPGHYVAFAHGRTAHKQYWSCIGKSRLSYKRDKDYDDHFLWLFEQSVRRRIGDGTGVVAELSGGVDSSSIVCMADRITDQHSDVQTSIGTISYFDDTEPDWDERPFFTVIENRRQTRGVHVDTSGGQSFQPLILPDRFYPYPGGDSNSLFRSICFAEAIDGRGYRIVISGIGGDELLGGVPTPLPELADYIARGQLMRFLNQGIRWSLATRQPLLHLVRDSVAFTWRLYRRQVTTPETYPPWLSANIGQDRLHNGILPQGSLHQFTTLPSEVSNENAWRQMYRSLPNQNPHLVGCVEYRFPYLDRDLVEFLHRVPRGQLVGPGRRRLLMRRALKDIVPTSILERRRKAYISRAPISSLRTYRGTIEQMFLRSHLAVNGFIDGELLTRELHRAVAGEVEWVSHLHQTIALELWLTSLFARTSRSAA